MAAELSKINNLIKLEDDLIKLDSLRSQFLKEKSSIDIKLSSTTQLQIDSIMNNLDQLNQTMKKLNNIKSNVNKITNIHQESTNIKDYDLIRKMSLINQYLSQVENIYFDISKFHQNLNNLNSAIEDEMSQFQNDSNYPLPKFLEIHNLYDQARNFHDYLERFIMNSSDDYKSLVQKITSPIKKTISLFDEFINECTISLTEYTKEGNFEFLFKFVAVISYEEKEDLKAELIGNLFQRDQLNGYQRIKKRNYKKFFFDKLRLNLQETFQTCVNHFSDDTILVFDNLYWLEEDLKFIKSLEDLFPWDIEKFFSKIYYDCLHDFTLDLIKKEPPAEDLLKILAYDKINPFDKSIIGELKESVLEDYLTTITNKMNEWNLNLIKQETESFTQRPKAPDVYPYEQKYWDEDVQGNELEMFSTFQAYVLPDFKTPLAMLKEQADVAASSGYSKILVEVIEKWNVCFLKRIDNFRDLIDDEMDRYISVFNNEKFLIKQSKAKKLFRKKPVAVDVDSLTPEEQRNISKEGLVEYLCALANSLDITSETLSDKFMPIYLEKTHANFHSKIQTAFESTVYVSNELISHIIKTICSIVINDLYPELCKVFTKAWYDPPEVSMTELIVETIAEYMQEIRSYSTYNVYALCFTILLDNFINTYIRIGYENVLHGDGKKIDPDATKKYKSFSEGIGRDISLFFHGLENLFTRKDKKYLFYSLKAIELLDNLGTCQDPLNIAPQIWQHEVLPEFYYSSIDYVIGVLSCRKDIDKSDIKQLRPKLQAIQDEYYKEVESPETPILTLSDFTYNA
ncbi:unnamed protein product [Candida verbasci]|uniref:Exocyst complex component Sec6 n=1 Tax=Candida verbasci TaxID=1227364 RepID=A0A9W4TYE3_9ASCO|nr:unnamed protein product [Candida verbasci]